MVKMQNRGSNRKGAECAAADAEQYKTVSFFTDFATVGNHFVEIIVLDERQIAPLLPTFAAIVHDGFISLCDAVCFLFEYAGANALVADGIGHHVVVIEFKVHIYLLM